MVWSVLTQVGLFAKKLHLTGLVRDAPKLSLPAKLVFPRYGNPSVLTQTQCILSLFLSAGVGGANVLLFVSKPWVGVFIVLVLGSSFVRLEISVCLWKDCAWGVDFSNFSLLFS